MCSINALGPVVIRDLDPNLHDLRSDYIHLNVAPSTMCLQLLKFQFHFIYLFILFNRSRDACIVTRIMNIMYHFSLFYFRFGWLVMSFGLRRP